MTDPNFFERSLPLSLKEISGLSGTEIAVGSNPDYIIEDVAPLDKAGSKDLSFFDNIKYKDQFSVTQAGACFISPVMVGIAPRGVNLLVSKTPYKAYALAAQAFYLKQNRPGSVSPHAVVDPSASLGKGSIVEHGAIIGAGVMIGDGVLIESNAVIGRNVRIGDHVRIGPNASISHALIGSHVNIYPGVRIGQEGFGFVVDPAGYIKIPQLGRVIIEDNVEIGANTTIDRGSGPDTVIGEGTWIDNLVQIAHNVKIGKGCIIAAQVGIAGSTVIEDFVSLGGQSGIAGHLRIGKGARIAAQSGVIRDVPAGEEQMGYPSVPKRAFFRQVTLLNLLIKKEKSS